LTQLRLRHAAHRARVQLEQGLVQFRKESAARQFALLAAIQRGGAFGMFERLFFEALRLLSRYV